MTNPHGGKRSGAGRPRQVDQPIRRTVYLDQRHIDLIENYRDDRTTFSQALRDILTRFDDSNWWNP